MDMKRKMNDNLEIKLEANFECITNVPEEKLSANRSN